MSYRLTRAADRRRMADRLACALHAVPGAVVTVEESPGLLERCTAVQASVNGFTFRATLWARIPDSVFAAWFAHDRDAPRLRSAFGSMIGGSVNPYHGHKATGPFLEAGRAGPDTGAFPADQLDAFAEIIRRALEAIADGGALEAPQALAA